MSEPIKFVSEDNYKSVKADNARLTAEAEQHRARAEDWKRLYEKAVNETTDDLIAEVAKQEARIAELERDVDTATFLLGEWLERRMMTANERHNETVQLLQKVKK